MVCHASLAMASILLKDVTCEQILEMFTRGSTPEKSNILTPWHTLPPPEDFSTGWEFGNQCAVLYPETLRPTRERENAPARPIDLCGAQIDTRRMRQLAREG